MGGSGEMVVAYMDGAYDQSGIGGNQQAGFGFTVVSGGDGVEDANATALVKGSGQVQTDTASPTFIGAVGHTNNTGELSALGEAVVVDQRAGSRGAGPRLGDR